MHRVYFDTNESVDNERYGLWLSKSIDDQAKIPGGPAEGMVVTIYMIGEIEMEATLGWDAERKGWTARPVEGTTRTNTETWEQDRNTRDGRIDGSGLGQGGCR